MLLACGDNTVVPDASIVRPYTPPRLAAVGDLRTTFDADGFPLQLEAIYTSYALSWDGGRLAAATATFTGFSVDHTVQVTPTYDGDRLVKLTSTCTGSCRATSRTDIFTYDGEGRLEMWNVAGYGTSVAYSRDDRGRVVQIGYSAGRRDDVEYADGPCPTTLVIDGARVDVRYDADGRLDDRYTITYNADGYIADFGGTGARFRPLVYEPGASRGLDLWPGHFNGGFVYGFPFRGELFRLDGGCATAMSSQATILSLALASILNAATPLPSG